MYYFKILLFITEIASFIANLDWVDQILSIRQPLNGVAAS